MEQEIATQAVGLGGATDFSLWKLFLRADFVVKAVILILIASSIFSWALIFDKVRLFRRIDISTKSFEDKFWKSKSAEAFYKNLPQKSEDPLTIIFKSAMNEVIKTRSKSTAVQSARVERVIEVSIDNQLKSIEKNFTYLATIGSTAPFIGLFGTVWGIMNSFRGLAQTSQATLSVVAPGISEALIATALGLFAAIPALIAYNFFVKRINTILNRYESFIEEFQNLLAR